MPATYSVASRKRNAGKKRSSREDDPTSQPSSRRTTEQTGSASAIEPLDSLRSFGAKTDHAPNKQLKEPETESLGSTLWETATASYIDRDRFAEDFCGDRLDSVEPESRNEYIDYWHTKYKLVYEKAEGANAVLEDTKTKIGGSVISLNDYLKSKTAGTVDPFACARLSQAAIATFFCELATNLSLSQQEAENGEGSSGTQY